MRSAAGFHVSTTPSRSVVITPSGEARTRASSRSLVSRRAASACFTGVMSVITPWKYRGPPGTRENTRASSRTQTIRPSRATYRYSSEKGSPSSSVRATASSTRSRSSGWIRSFHRRSASSSCQSSAG